MVEVKSVVWLLPEPPFDIGNPSSTPMRKPFTSKAAAYKYINVLNGINRVYYSLYSNSKPIINRIWFDFDSPQSYDGVKRIREWCRQRNLKHSIVFSGGGFHFYIFAKNSEPFRDPRNSLAAIHHEIIKDIGFTCSNDSKTSDVDGHIVGDVRRVVTLPGTYNVKRKRWALSLRDEEFDAGMDKVLELAKQQRNIIFIYGDELFDADAYKNARSAAMTTNVEMPEFKTKPIFDSLPDAIKMFPPCMQQCLLDDDGQGEWRNRFVFTIWSKELGLTVEQTDAIAKEYFSRAKRTDNLANNYEHYRRTNVMRHVYERDIDLPSCEKMFLEGRCPGKCKFYIAAKKTGVR